MGSYEAALAFFGGSAGNGDAEGARADESNYRVMPIWGASRSWEAAETDRLNRAHWLNAKDTNINSWLQEQLPTLRARAIYESRNNGLVEGVIRTLVEDVVGPDGPTLQIQSDDDAYDEAAEQVWREWFKAPTFDPRISGASLLKLWVRNLPRCGEFLARIETDPHADGPVQMRIKPTHPRRLATPFDQMANPQMSMGVEFDNYERPKRYWITEQERYTTKYVPYPADLIIHEFALDEECQARGFPWITPSLQSIADLRDYDAQIQDAARSAADQSGLLYTEHPDAPVWAQPTSTRVERRTLKTVPPGWKPFVYPSTMPPAQYPDFRGERQRDVGRPLNMPLLMVRLDSSRHNYSSARLDTQSWNRTVYGIQNWLSGTPNSYGTLNRLVDLVLAEARFTNPKLRRRPKVVEYVWTWTPRPHVDPTKETDAETAGLESRTLSFVQALAQRGTNLDTHLRTLQRVERAFRNAQVSLPAWMTGSNQAGGQAARDARAQQDQLKEDAQEKAEDEETADA